MRCAIWYHLQLKNVKNTPGGVLFLVKLQATKRITPLLSHVFQILQIASNRAKHLISRTCVKNVFETYRNQERVKIKNELIQSLRIRNCYQNSLLILLTKFK